KFDRHLFRAGMQPQLIRPAWTFCRAASPRRPGDRITVLLLRCRSPPLAQSGHASRVARCPLSGVKRTWASVTAAPLPLFHNPSFCETVSMSALIIVLMSAAAGADGQSDFCHYAFATNSASFLRA